MITIDKHSPLNRRNGAAASGHIVKDDGIYRASIVIQDREKQGSQLCGPELFESEDAAFSWIYKTAWNFGFSESDLELKFVR